MNYAVEMGPGAMIHTSSFITTGSGIQKLLGGDTHTDTQTSRWFRKLTFIFSKQGRAKTDKINKKSIKYNIKKYINIRRQALITVSSWSLLTCFYTNCHSDTLNAKYRAHLKSEMYHSGHKHLLLHMCPTSHKFNEVILLNDGEFILCWTGSAQWSDLFSNDYSAQCRKWALKLNLISFLSS
jgi:hypothetical protein